MVGGNAYFAVLSMVVWLIIGSDGVSLNSSLCGCGSSSKVVTLKAMCKLVVGCFDDRFIVWNSWWKVWM